MRTARDAVCHDHRPGGVLLNKGETITGRLAVRTLIELRITLAYLLKEESEKLWREW